MKDRVAAPNRILMASDNQLPSISWATSRGLVDYRSAEQAMEARVARIRTGEAAEMIWLLEHPPLYTAGTSARDEDLLEPGRFPVHRTGRGGQFTYHGPGQRVVYVMLDLQRRGNDVRGFVQDLERWLIASLNVLGVQGAVRQDRIGVWVARPEIGLGHEDKVAAIGIRVRRWVTFHGLSLNVSPTLDHFGGIVPCGISDYGVTSLADLGRPTDMSMIDDVLRSTFTDAFVATSLVDESAPI